MLARRAAKAAEKLQSDEEGERTDLPLILDDSPTLPTLAEQSTNKDLPAVQQQQVNIPQAYHPKEEAAMAAVSLHEGDRIEL